MVQYTKYCFENNLKQTLEHLSTTVYLLTLRSKKNVIISSIKEQLKFNLISTDYRDPLRFSFFNCSGFIYSFLLFVSAKMSFILLMSNHKSLDRKHTSSSRLVWRKTFEMKKMNLFPKKLPLVFCV